MTLSSTYDEAVRAYSAQARTILTPGPAATERATRELSPAAPLADQAEALAPLSAGLRSVAIAQLSAPQPAARVQAATGLLAQAVTDLQISARLLEAAEAEMAGTETTRSIPRERVLLAQEDIAQTLAILTGEATRTDRGAILPADLDAARGQLAGLVTITLDQVQERAAKTGQTAVSGLLLLGLGKVAEAASLVGMDLAQALGVGEKVTRLYTLVRDYALSAYNALAALFGPAIVQTAAQQALAWVNDVVSGEQFEKLLAALYETLQTDAQLGQAITDSPATLDKFVVAIQGVDELGSSFQDQIGLVDKLLRGFRLFSGAAVIAIPQATVLMGAAYLVITAFVVSAGADYVDAQRLKFLNRVPGVRQIVEQSLA